MEKESFLDLESAISFESRKRDHIEVALSNKVEARELSDFDKIILKHEALPDIDFQTIDLQTEVLGFNQRTPFLISSMTAGHSSSGDLNVRLAKAASLRGWLMGVGSQRRELTDRNLRDEWQLVRKAAPQAKLLGNIGIAQLIKSKPENIQALVDSLQAEAMIVHLNSLQEVMQTEGTTDFRGGLEAIHTLCQKLTVPVIVKETGCGISVATSRRLREAGVKAVDISGLGGTHWGRVEGERAGRELTRDARKRALAAATFANWGLSTVAGVMDIVADRPMLSGNHEIWGSGGVRSGLDAYKLLVLGATVIGIAKPILEAALLGDEALDEYMELVEYELQVAMFCTGQKDLKGLPNKDLWQWKTT